jgi:hypothetical protein
VYYYFLKPLKPRENVLLFIKKSTDSSHFNVQHLKYARYKYYVPTKYLKHPVNIYYGVSLVTSLIFTFMIKIVIVYKYVYKLMDVYLCDD